MPFNSNGSSYLEFLRFVHCHKSKFNATIVGDAILTLISFYIFSRNEFVDFNQQIDSFVLKLSNKDLTLLQNKSHDIQASYEVKLENCLKICTVFNLNLIDWHFLTNLL